MLAASLILLLLMAWELRLQIWLGKAICIRAKRTGWIVTEVRRRVSMQRRLLGIVLWHKEVSVALPNAACEHLGEITAQDFDRQVPNWLRLIGSPG